MIDETQAASDRVPDEPTGGPRTGDEDLVPVATDSQLSEPLPVSVSDEATAADGAPVVDDPAQEDGGDEVLEAQNEDLEEEEVDMDVEPIEQIVDSEDEDIEMDWYILKVQSNREESIREGLQRRVSVAGFDRFFGEIIVPTEDVAEFKNGKKRIAKRKLYPGYIVVHMSINDDTWFLVRETPGIGDFTGSAGRPSPMSQHEVERIVQASMPEEDGGEPIKTAIPFKVADRVRIKEGTFENFDGDVDDVDEANGRVTVMINIFGRSTPVELEHWQIEAV